MWGELSLLSEGGSALLRAEYSHLDLRATEVEKGRARAMPPRRRRPRDLLSLTLDPGEEVAEWTPVSSMARDSDPIERVRRWVFDVPWATDEPPPLRMWSPEDEEEEGSSDEEGEGVPAEEGGGEEGGGGAAAADGDGDSDEEEVPAAKAKAPPAKVTVVAAAKSRAEFVRLLLDLERKSEEVRALVRRRCPWYSAAEVDALHEEFVVARARAAAAGKSQPLLDALRSELTLAEEWVHREHELREMEAVRLLRHRAIWADGVTAVAPPREPGAPPGPARIVHPDAPAAWGGVPPVGAMAEKGASDAADAWPAALRAEVELALVRFRTRRSVPPPPRPRPPPPPPSRRSTAARAARRGVRRRWRRWRRRSTAVGPRGNTN